MTRHRVVKTAETWGEVHEFAAAHLHVRALNEIHDLGVLVSHHVEVRRVFALDHIANLGFVLVHLHIQLVFQLGRLDAVDFLDRLAVLLKLHLERVHNRLLLAE